MNNQIQNQVKLIITTSQAIIKSGRHSVGLFNSLFDLAVFAKDGARRITSSPGFSMVHEPCKLWLWLTSQKISSHPVST